MAVLVSICALVTLLSLVGIVWDFSSGLLTSDVDGLMLLAVCLVMGALFAWMGFSLARQAGWVKPFPRRKQAAAEAPPNPHASEKK